MERNGSSHNSATATVGNTNAIAAHISSNNAVIAQGTNTATDSNASNYCDSPRVNSNSAAGDKKSPLITPRQQAAAAATGALPTPISSTPRSQSFPITPRSQSIPIPIQQASSMNSPHGHNPSPLRGVHPLKMRHQQANNTGSLASPRSGLSHDSTLYPINDICGWRA